MHYCSNHKYLYIFICRKWILFSSIWIPFWCCRCCCLRFFDNTFKRALTASNGLLVCWLHKTRREGGGRRKNATASKNSSALFRITEGRVSLGTPPLSFTVEPQIIPVGQVPICRFARTPHTPSPYLWSMIFKGGVSAPANLRSVFCADPTGNCIQYLDHRYGFQPSSMVLEWCGIVKELTYCTFLFPLEFSSTIQHN